MTLLFSLLLFLVLRFGFRNQVFKNASVTDLVYDSEKPKFPTNTI